MKKSLLIFLFLPLFASAQFQDTALVRRIDNIELNLGKSHEQFQVGTIFIATGLLLSAGGIMSSVAGTTTDVPIFLYGIGSALSLTGLIIHLDSHKHIGRAGRWKNNL